ADGEVVGIGVGGGVQAAHVEGVAAAVDEAADGGGVGRAARGGEGLGHGVVGHARTRAVAAGGDFVGGEGERRLGRPRREGAHRRSDGRSVGEGGSGRGAGGGAGGGGGVVGGGGGEGGV